MRVEPSSVLSSGKERHVRPARADRLDRARERGVALEQRAPAPAAEARLRRELPRAALHAQERP